jgi:hypothetical protein
MGQSLFYLVVKCWKRLTGFGLAGLVSLFHFPRMALSCGRRTLPIAWKVRICDCCRFALRRVAPPSVRSAYSPSAYSWPTVSSQDDCERIFQDRRTCRRWLLPMPLEVSGIQSPMAGQQGNNERRTFFKFERRVW